MKGFPKIGEIRYEGGRLIDGLKGSSREIRSPLPSAYFREGNRREGERRHFEGSAKKTSSLLNLTRMITYPMFRQLKITG